MWFRTCALERRPVSFRVSARTHTCGLFYTVVVGSFASFIMMMPFAAILTSATILAIVVASWPSNSNNAKQGNFLSSSLLSSNENQKCQFVCYLAILFVLLCFHLFFMLFPLLVSPRVRMCLCMCVNICCYAFVVLFLSCLTLSALHWSFVSAALALFLLAGWLVGWMDGWMASWLAGWQASLSQKHATNHPMQQLSSHHPSQSQLIAVLIPFFCDCVCLPVRPPVYYVSVCACSLTHPTLIVSNRNCNCFDSFLPDVSMFL